MKLQVALHELPSDSGLIPSLSVRIRIATHHLPRRVISPFRSAVRHRWKAIWISAKILKAAEQSGAEAIHPGYGFLSENAEFAERCKASGLVFIGPGPEAIRIMGMKDSARTAAINSGVPVLPGYDGEDQSPDALLREAEKTGYPVLIKAAAGGGGKGMRVVAASNEFLSSLESVKRESLSAFGNDSVLVEKYFPSSRHIEIQVFADTHDNTVHLFERDCSMQRRYQKVVEESPAPFLTDALRSKMTAAAVECAKAIGYVGAGTIEFLVDSSQFYFLEMNTRLQVEHSGHRKGDRPGSG